MIGAALAMGKNPPEWYPEKCPQCGFKAHFHYTNQSEFERQSPLCWGHWESDCRGYAKWKAKLEAKP